MGNLLVEKMSKICHIKLRYLKGNFAIGRKLSKHQTWDESRQDLSTKIGFQKVTFFIL